MRTPGPGDRMRRPAPRNDDADPVPGPLAPTVLAPAALVATMFGAQAVTHRTDAPWSPWLIAAVAAAATAAAVESGLSTEELGLDPHALGRGLGWSAGVAATTAAGIAAGLAIPRVRGLFRNEDYPDLPGALRAALAEIPLRTVLPEEMLFRGVLLGLLLRTYPAQTAVPVQAALFGLWHVAGSLDLAAASPGIGDAVGRGRAGRALGAAGAVVFTGAAGIVFGRLRVGTGGLAPAVALHWAANGAGAVASALAWRRHAATRHPG
ncbi:MAG: CPBP family glutamic-type intramembrane protease [Gordonia sp. (in: high G+C Gram-positive bacteria)]|uniref:CPBP family glutamic-type intramembrane protease n=1 Tax=Gordonia sp. (in: high G+C Gram-positive bacteria) TaxID=84139 RepID=UPI0039E274A9